VPIRSQLIYSDAPGSLPAEYKVPPGLDLVAQSIVARFNGASASGAFLPVLSVYSQDGRRVGTFHPNVELAVGDTAVVTYAPFLRGSVAGSAGAWSSYGALVRRSGSQAITTGTLTTVSFNTVIWDTANMATGATFTELDINEDGLYLCRADVQFVTSAGDDFAAYAALDEVLVTAAITGQHGGRAIDSGDPTMPTIFPLVQLMMLQAGNGVLVRVKHLAGANRNVVANLGVIRVGTYAA
jgi:hypothetical protein